MAQLTRRQRGDRNAGLRRCAHRKRRGKYRVATGQNSIVQRLRGQAAVGPKIGKGKGWRSGLMSGGVHALALWGYGPAARKPLELDIGPAHPNYLP